MAYMYAYILEREGEMESISNRSKDGFLNSRIVALLSAMICAFDCFACDSLLFLFVRCHIARREALGLGGKSRLRSHQSQSRRIWGATVTGATGGCPGIWREFLRACSLAKRHPARKYPIGQSMLVILGVPEPLG